MAKGFGPVFENLSIAVVVVMGTSIVLWLVPISSIIDSRLKTHAVLDDKSNSCTEAFDENLGNAR